MEHTLILTEDGEVYSCGLGADGQHGKEFSKEKIEDYISLKK